MNSNSDFNIKKEVILEGVAAAHGIKIGKAYIFDKKVFKAIKLEITDIDEAIEQFRFSLDKSKSELQKILDLAVDKIGKDRALIFEAQIMILDDPFLITSIENRIREEKLAPAYIVEDEMNKYTKLISSSTDTYMQERAHDIEDIKNRIIRNLSKEKWKSKIPYSRIIVAESLTPSDTILFSKRDAQGFVTDFGGLTSHTAILARSLNLPAVVGLHDATIEIQEEDLIIVDGYYGRVIVNPSENTLMKYERKIKIVTSIEDEFHDLAQKPAITKDGHNIELLGNLDVEQEIPMMKEHNADGIGLVRTEQVFVDNEILPTEEMQFERYLNIIQQMQGKEVVIRVFDVGGDKVLPIEIKEMNPFLGWRGIRFLLGNKPYFKDQLRAIIRASAFGKVKLLLPMVTTVTEVKETITLIDNCKNQLRSENISFDENLEVGVMIEVPAMVVLIQRIAHLISFLSIGTNDLIQYLLAVDRTNEIVSELYQEFHPSVIDTLGNIFKTAAENNLKVTLCGEMAGDTLATPLLLGLGLRSFSVSPSSIPYIKKIINNVSIQDCQILVDQIKNLDTHDEIMAILNNFLKTNALSIEDKIFEEVNDK